MKHFLVMKLQGPMQAWGGHTYEDLRHSELIPTRSGILGLLAACLGVQRKDIQGLETLSSSISMAVRIDRAPRRIVDYHTIKEARRANRPPKDGETVQSWREYLCDAAFTVILWERTAAEVTLDRIKQSLCRPVFTPFLGRRSCPISVPLFVDMLDAMDVLSAFESLTPQGGVIYSDEQLNAGNSVMSLRDEPVYERKRQFATRKIFIHAPPQEQGHVSE